jgi:hypothetical protein
VANCRRQFFETQHCNKKHVHDIHDEKRHRAYAQVNDMVMM